MKVKTGYFIPALGLLTRCHALEPVDCLADGDPCADAVTDTYRGQTFTAQAWMDCSSFQQDTSYGHTTTVTGYPSSYPTGGKSRPVYVIEQCTLDSQYASACSCYYGLSARTVYLDETTTITVPFPTTATATDTTAATTTEPTISFPLTTTPPTTITVTVSVPVESTWSPSSSSSSSSTQSGYYPQYTPSLPFSYSSCDFDPLNDGPFHLLGPNGQFLMTRDNKLVEFSASEGDDASAVPGYRLHRSANNTAAENVYDIVFPGSGGRKTLYLAVFWSGGLGFVKHSSNGQEYVPAPEGRNTNGGREGDYVTTIWSVQCNGFVTAGLVGSSRFEFRIRDNGDVAVGVYRADRRVRHRMNEPRKGQQKKSVTGIMGFYVMPKAVIVPPAGDIPSGSDGDEGCLKVDSGKKKGKEAKSKATSDQCVSEDWKGYFIPKFDFQKECSFLHECWATCTQTMTSCNEAFLNMILSTCDSSNFISLPPKSHALAIQTNLTTACQNLAHFMHYHLSSTPHAFALYGSIFSQACLPSDDPSSSTVGGDKVERRVEGVAL